MEEREPAKYAIGDYVKLVDGKADIWIVERIEWWTRPKTNIQCPYFHLKHVITGETCQELNNTILKKDEGANLLYGEA